MRKAIYYIVFAMLLITLPVCAYAHSGGTDSKGGHYNRSTGEYHYHHGYSAHQHKDMDGDGYLDCPYEFDNKDYYNEPPKATIDPNLLKEMEEWHEKVQEYTYPEEYNQAKEYTKKTYSKSNNSGKEKLLTAVENKNKKFEFPEMTFLVPAFYIAIFILSQLIGLINEKHSESISIFILKLIIFTLPVAILLLFLT